MTFDDAKRKKVVRCNNRKRKSFAGRGLPESAEALRVRAHVDVLRFLVHESQSELHDDGFHVAMNVRTIPSPIAELDVGRVLGVRVFLEFVGRTSADVGETKLAHHRFQAQHRKCIQIRDATPCRSADFTARFHGTAWV